ncbi:cytochrome b561 and DOMON domain-containing protein At4g17280-like [Wolffia australiana]
MATAKRAVALFLLLATAAALIAPSAAQCASQTFAGGATYARCASLPRLGASLHWTYRPAEAAVDVAFRAPLASSGWVAWGLNPAGARMVGTQALVAVVDGAGSVAAFQSRIDSYRPSMQRGELSFNVSRLSAAVSGGVVSVFATIRPPNNATRVSHVWQASTALASGVPAGHPLSGDNVLSLGTLDFLSGDNVLSLGTLDFLSGDSVASGTNVNRRRNVHGILNGVSWGVLMPLGVVIARYVRVFESADPAWFYLHVACQCSAYVLGVAGWGTGLKLGSDSQGIQYSKHRVIGIVLFSLATLQVFALFLRPNKDHKRRIYWNVYHHLVGYSIIVLSVINIFEGFEILDREKNWRTAYIGVISAIAGVAVILEVLTWFIVIRRRRSTAARKGTNNGTA